MDFATFCQNPKFGLGFSLGFDLGFGLGPDPRFGLALDPRFGLGFSLEFGLGFGFGFGLGGRPRMLFSALGRFRTPSDNLA